MFCGHTPGSSEAGGDDWGQDLWGQVVCCPLCVWPLGMCSTSSMREGAEHTRVGAYGTRQSIHRTARPAASPPALTHRRFTTQPDPFGFSETENVANKMQPRHVTTRFGRALRKRWYGQLLVLGGEGRGSVYQERLTPFGHQILQDSAGSMTLMSPPEPNHM